MHSTFKPGQVLYVHPKVNGVEPGDVVVYRSGEKFIVHRVKAVNEGGFTAQGDNNLQEDLDLVPLDQVVGVVEKADDWGNLHPVTGGRKGLWIANLRWGAQTLYNWLCPVFGAPYRWLKARRWIGRVWHPEVTSIHLQTPEGIMLKYIVRGKTVATWQPQQRHFTCRKPYDLIIFPPGEMQ